MATQILDTELDVARKYLHFSQRELFRARFNPEPSPDPLPAETLYWYWTPDEVISHYLEKVKYWRARYNAAMAIEQEREEERKELDFSIRLDELRY